MLTTVAYQLGRNKPAVYALEVSHMPVMCVHRLLPLHALCTAIPPPPKPQHTYRILGNFCITKGLRGAFHEDLTRGENVEEYGRD